ncbi:UNVERIFIED_CONTAM: hypothetical protein HHA_454060 [Hammondia hammondi]|eukprot:XP_008887465.1 hypothetical protein HHA_454060 [Hammondia hammondi]
MAAAFERGTVGNDTSQARNAIAERRMRQEQLNRLRNQRTHKMQKQAAAKEIANCFKNKPPTGGGAPPQYRGRA